MKHRLNDITSRATRAVFLHLVDADGLTIGCIDSFVADNCGHTSATRFHRHNQIASLIEIRNVLFRRSQGVKRKMLADLSKR